MRNKIGIIVIKTRNNLKNKQLSPKYDIWMEKFNE